MDRLLPVFPVLGGLEQALAKLAHAFPFRNSQVVQHVFVGGLPLYPLAVHAKGSFLEQIEDGLFFLLVLVDNEGALYFVALLHLLQVRLKSWIRQWVLFELWLEGQLEWLLQVLDHWIAQLVYFC